MTALFSREILHFRHQLSHQQIDDLLKERESLSYPESKAASLVKLDNFLKITTLLNSQGIHYICLKGPILSSKIYHDPTYRTIGDFDFLLNMADIDRAVEVLQSIGFETEQDWPTGDKLLSLKKNRNQICLQNPETDALIELHWRLLAVAPVGGEILGELVKSNLDMIEFAGEKFVTLNSELELLFLVIHGGQHNWFRLKWLEDVHQIALQNRYDPEKFKEFVLKLHAQRMVNLCNAILAYIYHGEPQLPAFGKPSRFAVNFAKSRINAQTERQFETFTELIRYSICILTNFPGLGYKFRVIRFMLYSLREKNDQKSPFFSSVLHPLKHLKLRYRLQSQVSGIR